jgi:DNA (cytosine-5)-methyltransferase 1
MTRSAGNFIDLYAGCGGLSLGLMMAGWKGLFAIEKDFQAFETLEKNLIGEQRRFSYSWPKWLPKDPGSIELFLKDFRHEISDLCGKVDLIAGGPPCQGFSFAGRRNRNDRRNSMIHRYLQVVSLIRPSLLLMENVMGITIEHGRKARRQDARKRIGRPPKSYAMRLTEGLEKDYHVYTMRVRAADFGVPQHRPRFILIGLLKDSLDPPPSFDIKSLLEKFRIDFLHLKGLPTDRPVWVGEAISDLETRGRKLTDCTDSPEYKQVSYAGPITKYQKLMHSDLNGYAPNSMRLVNHRPDTRKRFQEILDSCRHGVQLNKQDRQRFGLKKTSTIPLDRSKPSHTLTTLPDDVLHYSEPRILTARECARIQSFPDWYEFCGKYATGGYMRRLECPRYTQIGNAVPPLLAEALGRLLGYIRADLLK